MTRHVHGRIESRRLSSLLVFSLAVVSAPRAWGEGYYEMKPHLATDGTHASQAKVKVRYWIED